MRILIIGATGGTGRQLVAQALEAGHQVTALVRNPSKLELNHERLTVVKGNVLDYPSVATAVKGQQAVISALGHKRWIIPSSILSSGTKKVVRAMQEHGVRRFICETSLGVGDSFGRLGLYYTLFTIPVILFFYFRDKGLQERYIKESSLDWVIVRPGQLTNGRKRGVYRHGPRVGSWLWTVKISRADVADFMLKQLTDNQYLNSTPGVCW